MTLAKPGLLEDTFAKNTSGTCKTLPGYSPPHLPSQASPYSTQYTEMFNQIILLLLSLSSFSAAQKTTTLHQAAKKPDSGTLKKEIAQLLSSDLDAVDEDGNTALMWSAWEGHSEHVQALLDAGATVDVQETEGNTALLKASWNGKDRVVQLLVNAGADINKMNYYKITSLMMASQRGHTELVYFLLANDANVHDKDQGGVTALHKAAWMGHIDIVKVLIENGANVNAPRHDGITPMALAESSVVEGRSHETALAVMKLLEDAGAEPAKKVKVGEL